MDTGFIVYNTATYPNLMALFDYLNVPTTPSLMGFGVSLDGGACEYSGDTLLQMMGNPGKSCVSKPLAHAVGYRPLLPDCGSPIRAPR